MNEALGNLNWNDPATVIAFAVDNNPSGVAAQMELNGYDIQGLNIDEYKDLLMAAYQEGLDLTWIGKLNYNPGQGNWTGQIFRDLQANTASKFTWENLGQVLTVAGSTLAAIFGVKNLQGGNQPAPTPTPRPTIMGIDQGLFWPLAFIALIIIALVLYIVLRKK